MDQSNALYTPPPQKRTKKIIALVVLAVSAALLAGAYAVYQWYPPAHDRITEAYVALTLPKDLKGAQFLRGDAGRPYHAETLEFTETSKEERLVPAGVRSSSGNLMVYAYGKTPNDFMPYIFPVAITPSDWTVATVQSESKELAVIGKGYAPAFLDDTHVAFFTSEGIRMIDLDTYVTSTLYLFPEGEVPTSYVRYSPDRTHLLWVNADKVTTLARIGTTGVEVINTYTFLWPALLTDQGLYEQHIVLPGDIEVWRHAFDGLVREKVITIPSTLGFKLLML